MNKNPALDLSHFAHERNIQALALPFPFEANALPARALGDSTLVLGAADGREDRA